MTQAVNLRVCAPSIDTFYGKCSLSWTSMQKLFQQVEWPGGGYSLEFLVGVCHPDPISDQKMPFPKIGELKIKIFNSKEAQ